MRVLRLVFQHSRRAVVVALLAGLVSGFTGTALVALVNSAINGQRFSRETLLWLFIALCIVSPVAKIAAELLLTRLGHLSVLQLRLQLCRQILAAPQRHLEEIGAPRLMSMLTGDVPAIATTASALPVLTINLALSLGCLIYLGFLSWRVLAGVTVVLLVGALSYWLPVKRADRTFRLARTKRDELYGHFRAVIDGSKELKLHSRRRQAFLDELLGPSAEDQRRYQVAGQSIYVVASTWGQLLVFLAIGALIFLGPQWAGGASQTETLNGFALVLLYMVPPLGILLNAVPHVAQADISLRRVEELGLDLQAHATDLPAVPLSALPSPTLEGPIELVQVTSSYHTDGPEEGFMLGPIDLTVEPGELLFIAGGNGSGKTTLAKVLVGLYPPMSGEVRLAGRAIGDADREAYRQHFSAVFSDFFLFEQLLGLQAVGDLDEAARRYLRELRLDHKVSIQAGKLSTTELSQGQRKRLALLTAYLEDRAVYVFDEWAADQDPMFREIFYLHILPELKRRGKAVVVISHDDRYYGGADRVVKLDAGVVTEITHGTAVPLRKETADVA